MRVLLYCGVLVFAAPTLLVFIMVYRYVRLHFLLRDLPGPSPSFYFGNAQKYLIDEKGERIPFLYMQKNLQKQYGAQGDLVKFSVGSVPMVEMYGVARFYVPQYTHIPKLTDSCSQTSAAVQRYSQHLQYHLVPNTTATNMHRQVSHGIASQRQSLFSFAKLCAPWL